MTLLSIIQDAANELSLPAPDAVIGNTETNVRRLLGQAQREGRELNKRNKWTVQNREHTFTTTSGTAEYSLPSDFDGVIANTVWDRSDYETVRGPLSPQEWQFYKSSNLGAGIINRRYRIKPSSSHVRVFVLDPTPTTTGDTLVFEYYSNAWCQSSGGARQTSWAADTDTGVLDEDLMTMGVVWRFLRQIGNDFDTQYTEYEQSVAISRARDLSPGDKMLSGQRRTQRFLGPENVPDTGYGS